MSGNNSSLGSMPQSYRALCFAQGISLLAANRTSEAITAFQNALRETGFGVSVAEILVQLANAYTQAGKQEDAFRTLLYAANIQPDCATECYRLAQNLNLAQLGTQLWPELKAEQLPIWIKMFRKSGQQMEAILLAARIAAAAGEHTQALELLKESATRIDSNPSASTEIAKQLDKVSDALTRAGKFDFADEALQLAITLEPADSSRRLTLMDVLYRKSFLQESPFVNSTDIARSILLWREALERGAPSDNEAWTWGTRACINEQLVRLPDCDRWKLGWEAVAHCERGLVTQPEETWHWINLARWYRFLGLPACEDSATKTLLELDREDTGTSALEERIIFLSNTERFDEMAPLIERWRRLDPSTWLFGVEGFAYLHQGNNRKAISLANKLLADQPDALWCRELRAVACRRMGKTAEAVADYEHVRQRAERDDLNNRLTFARALSNLAWIQLNVSADASRVPTDMKVSGTHNENLEKAIEVAENYRNQYALPTEGMLRIDLGFLYLVQGNIEKGKALIEEGIKVEGHFRELDELFRFEIQWYSKAIRSVAHGDAVLKILNAPDHGIKDLVKQRLTEISSQRLSPEDELQEMLSRFGTNGADKWLYVATQAGIARLRKPEQPVEAAEIYKLIRNNEPESIGLGHAALVSLNRAAMEEGNRLTNSEPNEATAIYEQVLFTTPSEEIANDAQAALTLLTLVRGEQDHSNPQSSVALSSPPGSALFTRIDEWFSTSQKSDSPYWPIATPIALEIGNGMVPEDTGENWVWRKTYIPEMRDRIQAKTGVLVPGVSGRGSSNPDPYFYAIEINGIRHPSHCGSAPPDEPEPLVYVMRHLESAILYRIEEFITAEDALKILEKWGEVPRNKEIATASLSSLCEQVHFSRLLRALVRDGVPLVAGDLILEALRRTPITSVSLPILVRSIRQQMRDCLPGNAANMSKINLSTEWETMLAECSYSLKSTLDSKNVHDLIQYVRSLNDGHQTEPFTLIVQNASAAPLVRRLLRYELPHVAVLAQEEAT